MSNFIKYPLFCYVLYLTMIFIHPERNEAEQISRKNHSESEISLFLGEKAWPPCPHLSTTPLIPGYFKVRIMRVVN